MLNLPLLQFNWLLQIQHNLSFYGMPVAQEKILHSPYFHLKHTMMKSHMSLFKNYFIGKFPRMRVEREEIQRAKDDASLPGIPLLAYIKANCRQKAFAGGVRVYKQGVLQNVSYLKHSIFG